MKTLATILTLTLFFATSSAQYPNLTIRQIQEVPLDSLRCLDSCLCCSQASPFVGDTVQVVAVCVVPPGILDYISSGFTMMLCDTGAFSAWGGIFVGIGSPVDTAQAIADGWRNVEKGDIVRMTGIVEEFPLNSPLSTTQLRQVPGLPISVIGRAPIPPPFHKQVGDFNTGIYSPAHPHFVTGEPFEGLVVEFTNLTIDAKVNISRGTFSAVDSAGNQITEYDASQFFTLGHGIPPTPPDSAWSITYSRIGAGTRIDTIRGYILTVSGSESPRGYRIAPIDRGDIVFAPELPLVYQHHRSPIVVPLESAATINARVVKQGTGAGIAGVSLFYSLNNAPFVSAPMNMMGNSTYSGTLPQQAENTFVHYYIRAVDSLGYSSILGNSSTTGWDTSKGFFFYTVLNRPLTIRDVQYTPYADGRSAYIGATASISGIVTADSSHIDIGRLGPWFVQSGREPWNAIWITDTASTLQRSHNGDSITATGVIAEYFDATQIRNFTQPVIIHSNGNPEPDPVVLPTSTLGTLGAEQWESTIVKFEHGTVSGISPFGGDFTLDDGSGPATVDLGSGKHHYTADPGDTTPGRIVIRNGDRISFLTGVLVQEFGRYDLLPRTDVDFGVITNVQIDPGRRMPQSYILEQNYPNPFNPTTTIGFQLPESGPVSLKVFDVLGREVALLVHEEMRPGVYRTLLDARGMASGVYYYRLIAGRFVQTKRLVVLR